MFLVRDVGDVRGRERNNSKQPRLTYRRRPAISPIVPQWLALKHGAKRVVGRDALPRTVAATIAIAIICGGLAMPEGEADKETLAHLFLTLGHVLQGLLLVVDFFVLGHVGIVAKVVEIARIRLRVQLWHERRPGLAQRIPVNLGEIVVGVDILNFTEALGA